MKSRSHPTRRTFCYFPPLEKKVISSMTSLRGISLFCASNFSSTIRQLKMTLRCLPWTKLMSLWAKCQFSMQYYYLWGFSCGEISNWAYIMSHVFTLFLAPLQGGTVAPLQGGAIWVSPWRVCEFLPEVFCKGRAVIGQVSEPDTPIHLTKVVKLSQTMPISLIQTLAESRTHATLIVDFDAQRPTQHW